MSCCPSYSASPGERYVYKFVCEPEALFSMAYGHSSATATSSSPPHSSELSSPASPLGRQLHNTPPSCSMNGKAAANYYAQNYVHNQNHSN